MGKEHAARPLRRLAVKRLILGAMVVLVISGCEGLKKLTTVSEAKVEAAKRWNVTRAAMVCAVALEQFKTGQLDSAAAEARKALTMDEKCLQARLLLAKVEIEKGRNAAACAELKRVLEQAPQSSEAFYLLGVAQEKAGQFNEALESYRRAYALDQSNLAPISAAAEVLVRTGRTREAMLYIGSYAPKADNDVELFELGGRVAVMTRDYAKAVTYYQRAADLDTANAYYRECLGRAQLMAGMPAEAADTLYPLTCEGDREASPWVYATLGDCYMAMQKPRLASEAYQRACRYLESSAGIRASLAKALLAEGDVSEAIATAKEALRLDAKCLEATLVLGYALFQDGQIDNAVRELTKAAADYPDESTLWCLLGRAHAAGGNEVSAIRCYTTALRVDPDSSLARELLDQTQVKTSSRM